jgi:uncharacterized protein YhfF
MIFRADLADLVVAGVKTQTCRRLSDKERSPWWREACAYKVGGSYAVQPGRGEAAIALLVIDAVDKVQLGHITHDDAVAEGCGDVRDFMHTWTKINGYWQPREHVWRLTFHAEPLPARSPR